MRSKTSCLVGKKGKERLLCSILPRLIIKISFQCFINEIYQFLLLMKKIDFTKFSVSNTTKHMGKFSLKIKNCKVIFVAALKSLVHAWLNFSISLF